MQSVTLLLVGSKLAGQVGVLVAGLRGVHARELLGELVVLGVDRGQRLLVLSQAAGEQLAVALVAVGSPSRGGRQRGELFTDLGGGL